MKSLYDESKDDVRRMTRDALESYVLRLLAEVHERERLARLDEHGRNCIQMSYGIGTKGNLTCGDGWSCGRRAALESEQPLLKEADE